MDISLYRRNMTSLDQEWLSYLCSYQSGKEPHVLPIHHESDVEVGTDIKMPVVLPGSSQKSIGIDIEDGSQPLVCPHTEYELIISTKTKVLFLNQPIDIHSIFWEIPVIDYWAPVTGVLKKQIKLVSKTPEEYQQYCEKLKPLRYFKEQIIKQIDNPAARSIKFKDERKLTVGLARKDILSYRVKLKNAFYNCFAIVMRFQLPKAQPETKSKAIVLPEPGSKVESEIGPESDKNDEPFREVHVKVFNTGKLEIPGIVDYRIMHVVKDMIMQLLKPLVNKRSLQQLTPIGDLSSLCESTDGAHIPPELPSVVHTEYAEGSSRTSPYGSSFHSSLVKTEKPIEFIENSHEDHVLINSNFNCGYYINRDRLYTILKNEPYYIDSSYDPCTYPGVKCKFYFNRELGFDPLTQRGCIMKEDAQMKMSELNDSKKYTEVSFMIFRTGSCLIVGNCTEKVLRFVFEFIKNLLIREYANICIFNEIPVAKKKKTGIRTQHAYFTNS